MIRYVPFNDGYGIVGWSWNCDCGVLHELVSPGEVLPCGRVVPDVDPDDWYEAEMAKPVADRAWNQKTKGRGQ